MSFLYASFLWLLIPLVAYVLKGKKHSLALYLRWGVLALLVVALARPVVAQKASTKEVMSHSLIVALDLSVSMNANDIAPTRAKASRAIINKFLETNKNDQIALIGFTSNPLLLSPPTTDHGLVKIALANMNTDYLLTKGTNLKKLFKKVAQFSDKEKRLILLSDGGDEVLDDELIDLVEEEHITLFVVGMGTKQGASVAQKDGTLLQDTQGNIIVSRLNDSLERLAKESGGEFMAFGSVEATVSAIEHWINSADESELLTKQSRAYFELAFLPIGLALVLFFLSSTHFIRFVVAFLLLVGITVQANEPIRAESWGEGVEQIEPSSWEFLDGYRLQKAYEYYEKRAYKETLNVLKSMSRRGFEAELLLAHVYYKLEHYQKAKSLLKNMQSSTPKVKQQLFYELGNCEAKLAYWEKAKEYYIKALQLGEDADSLHNLQVVIFQKQKHNVKMAAQHGSQAKATKNSNLNSKEKKESHTKESKSDVGTGGGDGSTKNKQSVVKVVKSESTNHSKRTMSSKAYDLINEGYIREKRPW